MSKTKKVLAFLGTGAGAILLPLLTFAQVTSSTLGTNIDTIGTNWNDFLSIFFTKGLPLVLVIVIVSGLVGFLLAKIGGMFRKR